MEERELVSINSNDEANPENQDISHPLAYENYKLIQGKCVMSASQK